jgi:hypothetical protein
MYISIFGNDLQTLYDVAAVMPTCVFKATKLRREIGINAWFSCYATIESSSYLVWVGDLSNYCGNYGGWQYLALTAVIIKCRSAFKPDILALVGTEMYVLECYTNSGIQRPVCEIADDCLIVWYKECIYAGSIHRLIDWCKQCGFISEEGAVRETSA